MRRLLNPRRWQVAGAVAGSLVGLWLLLAIPGAEPFAPPAPERGRGFAWNQDTLWRSLETAYVEKRLAGCRTADRAAAAGLSGLAITAERLGRAPMPSDAAALDSVERRFFALAPLVAACPRYLRDYVRLSGRLREAIKWQSRRWDVAGDGARVRLYRSLYGFRGAVEEAMLQHPDTSLSLLERRCVPAGQEASDHGAAPAGGPGAAPRGPVAATPGSVARARARAVGTHRVRLRHGLHGPLAAVLLGGGLVGIWRAGRAAVDGVVDDLGCRATSLVVGVWRAPLRDAGAVRSGVRSPAGRRGGMARRRSAHAGPHRQRRHRRDARRSGSGGCALLPLV